jgi:hypothetical protein
MGQFVNVAHSQRWVSEEPRSMAGWDPTMPLALALAYRVARDIATTMTTDDAATTSLLQLNRFCHYRL